MKRTVYIIGLLALGIFLVLAASGWQVETAAALPEYASQTGEPCATCHVSPSGGGVRTPRGQAWVAGSKPAEVPDLIQALDLLGVRVQVDPEDYLAPQGPFPEAQSLQVKAGQVEEIHTWLQNYPGN